MIRTAIFTALLCAALAPSTVLASGDGTVRGFERIERTKSLPGERAAAGEVYGVPDLAVTTGVRSGFVADTRDSGARELGLTGSVAASGTFAGARAGFNAFDHPVGPVRSRRAGDLLGDRFEFYGRSELGSSASLWRRHAYGYDPYNSRRDEIYSRGFLQTISPSGLDGQPSVRAPMSFWNLNQ